jgi:single-strand DNA-binding protein
MSGEGRITVTGNVGSEPEIKFLDSGRAVCSFSVANTPRVKDPQGNWGDGETIWFRVTLWGRLAEAAVEDVQKGKRVIVDGRLTQRSYTTKEGEQRTSLEITADEIGVIPKLPKVAGQAQAEENPWP